MANCKLHDTKCKQCSSVAKTCAVWKLSRIAAAASSSVHLSLSSIPKIRPVWLSIILRFESTLDHKPDISLRIWWQKSLSLKDILSNWSLLLFLIWKADLKPFDIIPFFRISTSISMWLISHFVAESDRGGEVLRLTWGCNNQAKRREPAPPCSAPPFQVSFNTIESLGIEKSQKFKQNWYFLQGACLIHPDRASLEGETSQVETWRPPAKNFAQVRLGPLCTWRTCCRCPGRPDCRLQGWSHGAGLREAAGEHHWHRYHLWYSHLVSIVVLYGLAG